MRNTELGVCVRTCGGWKGVDNGAIEWRGVGVCEGACAGAGSACRCGFGQRVREKAARSISVQRWTQRTHECISLAGIMRWHHSSLTDLRACVAGFAYAPDATEAFLREAQGNGAQVHYSQAALDFITDDNHDITGMHSVRSCECCSCWTKLKESRVQGVGS